MPSVTKKCKVCGAEYPYCKTVVKDGVFRYQDVACCPEHGSIYLAQIMASRTTEPKEDSARAIEDIIEESEPSYESVEEIIEALNDIEEEEDEFEEDEDDWDEDEDEEDSEEEDV